jgi:thioredoxin 1
MKLIEFWAEWCAPCKRMAPVVEEVAKELGLTLVKVDIDQDAVATDQMAIRSVPTLVLVDDSGVELERWVGAMNKTALLSKLTLRTTSDTRF